MPHRFPQSAILVLAGMSLVLNARGAERITLANGFDVVCDHHVLVDGRIRMYPKANAEDYMELNPEAIRTVETVPDPAPEALPVSAADAGSSVGAKIPAAKAAAVLPGSDARLTASDLHEMLSKAGAEHHLDEDLLASVVKAESGGNAHARSRAGACGLMQLMPGTARVLGVVDSFAPEENVRGGTAYLDELLRRYRDNIVLALAAYNAGPEAVERYHGIPPYHETRVYVARVIHEFNRRVAARARVARALTAAVVPPQGTNSGSGTEPE